jgi:CRP/FNR family transcriptional regulator, cyclic AMP receptor protein
MEYEDDHRALTVRGLLESVGATLAFADYGPRSVIFLQGDPCDSVMHIEKGCVRLAVTAPSGKEAICGLLGAGAFLGEEALIGQALRRRTAIATTAVEVLVVAKAQMLGLLRTEPAIADRFIAHIISRNATLEANLTDQLLHSSEQRLARTLLVLAGCDERRRRGILPDVSQEIIAEMVGTTRSHVNALMGKFSKLGFIEKVGKRLEVNAFPLRVIHDADRRVSNGTSWLLQTLETGNRQVESEISNRDHGGDNGGVLAAAGGGRRAGKATERCGGGAFGGHGRAGQGHP